MPLSFGRNNIFLEKKRHQGNRYEILEQIIKERKKFSSEIEICDKMFEDKNNRKFEFEINKIINYEEKSNKEDKKENDESPMKEEKKTDFTQLLKFDKDNSDLENDEINKINTNINNNDEFDESSFESISKDENKKSKSLPLKKPLINLDNFEEKIKKENMKQNEVNIKKEEQNDVNLMATVSVSIDKIEEIQDNKKGKKDI